MSMRSSLLSSLDTLLRRRPRALDLEGGAVELGLRPKNDAQQRPPARMRLDDVPNDVLIMLFSYLDVIDVISLRQVSKFFHDISHHSIIWKRFLRQANVPIPPLPPTSRHSFPSLSGFEAERLLLRSVSLEQTWSSRDPSYVDAWVFNANYTVFSMATVPGGQYLIASVGNSIGSSGRFTNYSLVIYAMDHPHGGAHPIARTHTETKAYHLKARYTTIRGRRSIAIAYVRRDWGRRSERGKPNPSVDVSAFSGDHEIDPPTPIKYECVALETPLECLELLSDPRLTPGTQEWKAHAKSQPKPFRWLATIRTRSQLMYPDIDELFGKPYLAVLKKPNSIMFKNLEGGLASTLTCSIPDLPNQSLTPKIFNIRLVSIDNAVLVVRRLDGYSNERPNRKTFVELYHAIPTDAPAPNDARVWSREAFNSEELPNYDYIDCSMSDHGIPTRIDDSVLPQLYSAIDSMIPHPITFFLRTREQDSLHRWVMFPEKREQVLPPSPAMRSSEVSHLAKYGNWHYRFDHIHETIRAAGTVGHLFEHRALPGSLRSIVYSVPRFDISDSPPISSMGRQYCRHSQSLQAAQPLFEQQAEHGVEDSPNTFVWIPLPPGINFGAVNSMLWDETIGRLFIASKGDEEVFVIDFAKTIRLGKYGERAGSLPVAIHPNPNQVYSPIPRPRPDSPVAQVDKAALAVNTEDVEMQDG
ncbi:uncharacterized protein C8Q71DRAFT_886450 [Rhodofomes roseus]|uniref:F-box domain-containing protein n=1 Tax=Rhodofomes roseus TaxID=34475 RepID=A0ABQ8K241_9APHY|nr:uncharacterized protein C8Q71DRAFT_886450 [Rhodofomes roseus]KAH9830521.1 hypothetical protein C8Q71DRAFT_886450 [Rhodofomes roseus]